MKLSGETKVGLLALVAGVILYVGFNYLKGIDFFDPTTTYYVVYDRVDGLTVSNQVQINGMSVGRVAAVTILQDRGNQLLVTLDIQDDIKLGKGTIAQLSDNGLLGGKKIDLLVAFTEPKLNEGDTLLAKRESGMTEMLMEKASPVMQGLDSTLVNINRLVKEYQGMSVEVRKIMTNTADASGQANSILAENRGKITEITANINKLTAQLIEAEKSIRPLVGKMNTFADSLNAMQLASTVKNANRSLESLQKTMQAIEQGQGSLGKLVATDSLHTNLNRTLVSLDSLFIDLKARPKRYVHFSLFGKKDPAAKK
ncbi:MlaD family protein [Rhodoflexus caldus]|uniref:MlaD family protein n=1 Tax=Rhodoflexus caldus TaxID=2891236 RepID=UPI00202A7518|nr:MlaD family protein [Rhodoflexus caldus]